MIAIIKIPEDLVDESPYITRQVKSASNKSIAFMLENLCDELAYEDPEAFEVISVVTSDGDILLNGVDF